MDIHKPKPWHGVREFLKEYLIIVVGVLTALGAEQAVEQLHWAHEAEFERATLDAEVGANLNAIGARSSMEPCVEHRLGEIQTVLERHAAGTSLGIQGPLGRPASGATANGSWKIAVAGQGLAHMAHSEQLAYSAAFSNFEAWETVRTEERQAWFKLQALDIAPLLQEADWAALRQSYSEARIADQRAREDAPFILRAVSVGSGHDQKTAPISDAQILALPSNKNLCRPLLGR